MTTSVSSSAVTNVSERFIGRVKWFNNKAGYGFITVTDGSRSGTDIFVHHSSIKVDTDQYKYLVNGEYVEFGLTKTTNSQHEYQAEMVCGIKGGKLMCETHNELRLSRNQYRSTKREPEVQDTKVEIFVPTPKSVRAPRQKKQTDAVPEKVTVRKPRQQK
jgi:CspA family cold shock protein